MNIKLLLKTYLNTENELLQFSLDGTSCEIEAGAVGNFFLIFVFIEYKLIQHKARTSDYLRHKTIYVIN